MVSDDVLDALANDPALAASEREGRPVLVADAAGDIVWAGPAGSRLVATGGLDASSRRTLARMASAGSDGPVRLRLGASGRVAPLDFRARPLDMPGAATLLVLEAPAADDDAPRAETPPPSEAAASPPRLPNALAGPLFDDSSAPEARDVAAEEGAAEGGPRVATPPFAGLEDDPPPDPRRDLSQAAAEPVDEPAPAADLRFIFEIDADGRISFLSPDLGRAVGPSAQASLGERWGEVAETLRLDPDGAVAAALDRRDGWGDLAVAWPMADGRRLPIALSALPMFDRGRAFVGFRGLGRAVGEPKPAAGKATPEPVVQAETSDFRPESADMADQDVFAVDVAETPAIDAPPRRSKPTELSAPGASDPAPERDERPAEPPLFAPPAAPETYGGNVVPLREAAPPIAALSTLEENAFDEIARRLRGLGARVTDAVTFTEGAELVFAPDTAAISPTPAGDGSWTIDDVDGRAPTASRVEDLLRLLDRLPVGALALRAGAVAYANRAALETLGHPSLASLQTRSAEDLFAEPPPRDDAAPATIRVIASDGLEVEVEARLATIVWDGGPATLVSLKRAEGAIAAAHTALARAREASAILDVAADGVLTLDGAGRILCVNRAAETLFGFEGRDVIGSLFTLSLAPESRRVAFDYLDQLRANGGAAVTDDGREVLGLARKGGAIPLHLTIGRVGGREEERFCAVLRDISPWKKAEEELLAARRQAERANAHKSEFLAKISHEIRTPLNAIIGFAEVMMEERFGPVGSPRYKDYLRDIHVSGGHLVGLVNDLLDITRIESGGMKLDFSPVDLNEIAAQAAALLQPQANRDHVIIRTSLARGLPPVLADRRSVRQIMTNLASNAVRLSRPGGQVIVATALTDFGQAVIRVRDAGLGMSKQELARALEPFRSLGTADNDAGATLGLPLTRALAEANEAGFALQSEIGQGTLAEVTFPASRVLAV